MGGSKGALATSGRAETPRGIGTTWGPVDFGSSRQHQRDRQEGRDPLRPRQKVLIALELFVSLCGLGGGVYMATHPLTTMSLRYLQGTWFHTWRWPGLALILFVGVCPALVALATLMSRREASVGHLCVGIGLVAWVTLEAAWIVVSPGLQIAFGAIGMLIIALAIMDSIRSGDPQPGEDKLEEGAEVCDYHG